MIQFSNVSKRYRGGHEALTDLSFELRAGEMAFLTGHSGAGKTTVLKLIPLIERPTSGQIMVGERHLARIPRRKVPALRREMGIIFQNSTLLHDRNLFENVALPLWVSGELTPREVGKRVRAALDKVGLLAKERQLPAALSGGEQQRVGIARAVVGRPKILLADEPTGNLDPALAREIMGLLQQFNQVGVTVLVASHNLELLARFGKRTLVLEHGRLVADRPALVAA